MNYTELDWRWAIVLGVALRDGLLDKVADEPRSAEDVARRLDFDPRATYVLLSALGELGILEEDGGRFLVRRSIGDRFWSRGIPTTQGAAWSIGATSSVAGAGSGRSSRRESP